MKKQTELEVLQKKHAKAVLRFKKNFIDKVIATLSQKTGLPLGDMIEAHNEEKDNKKMASKGKILRRFSFGEVSLVLMKIEFYKDETFSIFLNGKGAPSKEERLSLRRISIRLVKKIKKHLKPE